MRTRRTAGLAGALLVVLALLTPAAASAEQEPPTTEELGLEVVVGLGGRATGAAWTPVEVVLEPTRLFVGEVAAVTRSSGGRVTASVPVEVAAGTRQVHRFLVPSGALSVRVTEDGRDPLELRPGGREPARGYVVGVLDAVPEGAPALRDEPTDQQGTWVAVDRAWLERSPDALAGLAALVVPASALAELGPAARLTLGAAAAAGLEVLLVADAVTDADALAVPLPVTALEAGAVRPAGGARVTTAADLDAAGDETPLVARVPAGHGGVAVVVAAPGDPGPGRDAALWAGLTHPRAEVDGLQREWAVESTPFQLARMLATPGDATPTLPWLAAFLVAYVVVVGPVNGVVLGRLRRRELAWATIPIVTVVFTAGAFLGMAGGRTVEAPAGRVLVAVDGAATEHVVTGVRAATGGVREVVLAGTGWRTALLGSADAELREDGSGVRARLDLTALELGGVVASRPVADPPPMTVRATAGAEGVAVTVRNTGGTAMADVAVRAATASAQVGDLAPGEEREVVLDRTELPGVAPYRDVLEGLGGGPPRSFEALLRDRVVDGNPGVVWAVGTLPPAGLPLEVGGAAAQDQGILVAVGATPAADGALSPFAVQREVLTPQRAGYRPSPQAVDGVEDAVLRFRLPGDASPEHLRVSLRGVPGRTSVWEPGARRWRPAAELLGEGLAGGDPAALVDPFGVVHLRVEGDLYPLDFSSASVDGLTPGEGR